MPLVTADFGNGPQQVWQNDDGTYWSAPDGAMDASGVRPDLQAGYNSSNLARVSDFYNHSGYQQFTPEQVQAFQSSGGSAKPNADSPNLNPAWGPNLGVYGDSMYGGNNLWYGPQSAPLHTDNGFLNPANLLTAGAATPYSETFQSAWNDMKPGLGVLAMPFVGGGITAGLAAAGAGGAAAGAGAAEGGAVAGGSAAAGAGAAEGGALAGGTAAAGTGAAEGAAGAAGAASAAETAAGAAGGAEGSAAGGAGVAGASGSSSGVAGGSAMGEGFDPSLLEDPSYWNPEGGTTGLADPGASGIAGSSTTYGSTDYLQSAQDMAKQLGITPAAALKFLMTAGGAALGAAKGGSKPAGTTTTTQDLPAWLQPYAQGNVAQGFQTLQGINPNNPLLPASQNEAMKTINGDYLNPNSNPYFASSVNDALGLAKSQFAGMYGGGPGNNLDNSGFQEGLARTLGQQATNAYSQNYQNERSRQATAAFGAPQLVSQGNAAQFSGNQAFAGLFPNVSSTSVPYFSNPLGSAFSGALGGYALSGGMGK